MKLCTHLQVLRLGRLVLWSFIAWGTGYPFASVLHSPTGPLPEDPALLLFTANVFLSPIFLGWVLAATIQSVQRRPFALLLPNASIRLARRHALLVAIAAALAALIGPESIALPVLFCVTAGGLSLMLPWDATGRWYGLHRFVSAAGILTIVIGGALYAPILRDGMHTAPVLSACIGLAIATGCFVLGFSRSQMRRLSQIQRPTLLECGLSQLRSQSAADAASRQIGRRWTGGLVDGTLYHWLRVAIHERYGFSLLSSSGVMLVFLGILFYADFQLGAFAEDASWLQKLYVITNGPHWVGWDRSIHFILLLGATICTPLLRGDQLYPLSRHRRALVSYVSSFAVVLVYSTGILLFTLCGGLMSAAATGQPFHTDGIRLSLDTLLVASPFLPLFAWGAFRIIRLPDGGGRALFMLSLFLAGRILNSAFHGVQDWIHTPAGLSICLLAAICAQAAYYLMLRQFYRKGDLLQPGEQRQHPAVA